jgi:hypothetical protein
VGNTYGLRTWIEYGFKPAKNELGWAEYRLTDYASIERWWELVFCAYSLVSFQCSALQTHEEEPEPQLSRAATPVDHFASASLVGYRSWLEKCPEQLAAHSPALYLFLFALTLVVGVRHSLSTSRFCRTYWNYELVSFSPPHSFENEQPPYFSKHKIFLSHQKRASVNPDPSNFQQFVKRSPLLGRSKPLRSLVLGAGGRNDGRAAPDPAGGSNRLPDRERARDPARRGR